MLNPQAREIYRVVLLPMSILMAMETLSFKSLKSLSLGDILL